MEEPEKWNEDGGSWIQPILLIIVVFGVIIYGLYTVFTQYGT